MTYVSAKFFKVRRVLLASFLALALGACQVQADSGDAARGAGLTTSRPSINTAVTDAALANAESGRNTPLSLMPPKIRVSPKAHNSFDTLTNFGPPSGTEIGQRAIELRDEVLRLRGAIANDSNEFTTLRSNGATGAVQYHSTVAAITARLQHGTTRGNPILQRQWHEAEHSLNQVHESLGRLNGLSTAIATDASQAGYLLESIQASFQLSGAVDEDHDQLALLRDEVSRLIVQTDYLRTEVVSDIQRQTSYLTSERTNLQALSFAISRGEMFGPSLGNRATMMRNPSSMAVPPSGQNSPQSAPLAAPTFPVAPAPLDNTQRNSMTMPNASDTAADQAGDAANTGKLLVLIRFNQDNVPYERQLSQAVAMAIDRRPNAQFTVVGVAPTRGDAEAVALGASSAQRNAEAVKTTLLQMGLSAARISVANSQGSGALAPEVHVYVR